MRRVTALLGWVVSDLFTISPGIISMGDELCFSVQCTHP